MALQPVMNANNRRGASSRGASSDRFIPSRRAMDLDVSSMEVERSMADESWHDVNAS